MEKPHKETRNTKQKQLILDCMKNAGGAHMTAEEIYNRIRQESQTISIATVYRNLRLLEENGTVKKVYVADDSLAYYEMSDAQSPHAHHHLVCRKCGAILDFEADLLDGLERLIESTKHFQIEDHRVVFYGVCEACRRRDGENAQPRK
ncbi:Fur family transcriptional regulator [Ethanoligenens harbinense]|uniref:Fur family transcriptional regulator n=1 Tax=Ethanoligenens harbinense TaxID=253239 RepID=UPI00059EFB11|nr:transcriptional repressor [Ethanoligenens harbinense]